MLFNPVLVVISLSLPYLVSATIGDSCKASEGSGLCQKTNACSDGFTVTGACPNDPNDVKCCIKKTCKDGAGTCLDKTTAKTCGGHFEAGFCPGPTNVQCFIKDKITCPTYWVIGVRGSQEPRGTGADQNIANMGETIERYVLRAVPKLPIGTEYLGLPYPAALDSVKGFFDSEEAGWQSLQAIIKSRVCGCPNIKIALAGYSQGAAVVNDALHFLASSAPETLDNIRSVLLLADPKADHSQTYHAVTTLRGVPPETKSNNDGILGPQALPAQVKGRSSSLCIENDIVCDASNSNSALIVQGMLAVIHLGYITCCTQFLFPQILGEQLATRLLA